MAKCIWNPGDIRGNKNLSWDKGSSASEKKWDKKAKAHHQPEITTADMPPGGKLQNKNGDEVEKGIGQILDAFTQGRHMDLKALGTFTSGGDQGLKRGLKSVWTCKGKLIGGTQGGSAVQALSPSGSPLRQWLDL